MGADMVECDINRTVDGVLYSFHDGYEPDLFRVQKSIKQMTSAEVDAYRPYNAIRQQCRRPIERLSDILDWLPADKLLNIDRAWDIFPYLLEELDNFREELLRGIGKILDFLTTGILRLLVSLGLRRALLEFKSGVSGDGLDNSVELSEDVSDRLPLLGISRRLLPVRIIPGRIAKTLDLGFSLAEIFGEAESARNLLIDLPRLAVHALRIDSLGISLGSLELTLELGLLFLRRIRFELRLKITNLEVLIQGIGIKARHDIVKRLVVGFLQDRKLFNLI